MCGKVLINHRHKVARLTFQFENAAALSSSCDIAKPAIDRLIVVRGVAAPPPVGGVAAPPPVGGAAAVQGVVEMQEVVEIKVASIGKNRKTGRSFVAIVVVAGLVVNAPRFKSYFLLPAEGKTKDRINAFYHDRCPPYQKPKFQIKNLRINNPNQKTKHRIFCGQNRLHGAESPAGFKNNINMGYKLKNNKMAVSNTSNNIKFD